MLGEHEASYPKSRHTKKPGLSHLLKSHGGGKMKSRLRLFLRAAKLNCSCH